MNKKGQGRYTITYRGLVSAPQGFPKGVGRIPRITREKAVVELIRSLKAYEEELAKKTYEDWPVIT